MKHVLSFLLSLRLRSVIVCLSTTCVNTILPTLPCAWYEKRLFLAPTANPLSQAFCIEATSSNTRILVLDLGAVFILQK